MNAVLERAVEVMRKRGHTTGTMESRSGQVCLVGAVHVTLATYVDLDGRHTWHDALSTTIIEQYPQESRPFQLMNQGRPYVVIAGFNDRVITSTDEAIALLEKASQA